MFTELYKDCGLTINTIPNYVLITVNQGINWDGEVAGVDYYLVPLSDISQSELEILEYESYFDSDVDEQLDSLIMKIQIYKTEALVIKANIVAVYRK